MIRTPYRPATPSEQLRELARRARATVEQFRLDHRASDPTAEAVADLADYLELLDGACPSCGSTELCDCPIVLVDEPYRDPLEQADLDMLETGYADI